MSQAGSECCGVYGNGINGTRLIRDSKRYTLMSSLAMQRHCYYYYEYIASAGCVYLFV